MPVKIQSAMADMAKISSVFTKQQLQNPYLTTQI